MAIQYFVPAPDSQAYAMWDGTNLQEIIDLTSGFIPPTIVDNEDGTLTINGTLVTNGMYVNRVGSVTDMSHFQEVPGPVAAYVLE